MAQGPAAAAGLKVGDVIVRYAGREVEHTNALRHMVAETKVGDTVKVEVMRDKKPEPLTVRIAEQPADMGRNGDTGEAGVRGGNALAGVEVRGLTPDAARGLPAGQGGVVVSKVDPDSTAAEAGVRAGDVIVEINRERVRDVGGFKRLVGKLAKDEGALLLILRQGGKLFLVINP